MLCYVMFVVEKYTDARDQLAILQISTRQDVSIRCSWNILYMCMDLLFLCEVEVVL
jgi:hypothetical protein